MPKFKPSLIRERIDNVAIVSYNVVQINISNLWVMARSGAPIMIKLSTLSSGCFEPTRRISHAETKIRQFEPQEHSNLQFVKLFTAPLCLSIYLFCPAFIKRQ